MSYKTTLLLIPYFGKLPSYLNLFFKGCENNKWLDVLIITNDEIPHSKPTNVSFYKSNLEKLSEEIAQKFNIINYHLTNSYKLCDWRPAYGIIFSAYIENYDYWAYGDLDVIYGNMHSYVHEKYNKEVDFISFRKEYLSGSFTIIKNNNYNNALFLKIEDYISKVQAHPYQALDEIGNRWDCLYNSNENKSFSEVVYKNYLLNNVSINFENVICENIHEEELITFNDPELIYNEEKILYYHYVCNKGKYFFKFPNWKLIPEKFYIADTGFHKKLKRTHRAYTSFIKMVYAIPYYFIKIKSRLKFNA